MTNFWYIKGDFRKTRSGMIGASDIPALIPDPERPTETLAGYGRTPITVWQEKTGRKEREPTGLPAEMGNFLEGKCIELFVRLFSGREIAMLHLRDRQTYDMAVSLGMPDQSAGIYQKRPYKHHAQFHRDGMICHPDAIYDPEDKHLADAVGKHTHEGVTVDLDKPFLLEAKSANFWATKRPADSVVRGYDFNLKTWQGIPLKHYMQIQFQLALLEVDVAYLPLISNTSEFHIWQIRANKKHQGRLIDLAGKMVHHIETDTPPGDLAMNATDIMALYPDLGDDFAVLNGPERDAAVDVAREFKQAEKQTKRWADKKTDAKDAMSVLLRDRPELRDGDGIISRWITTKGSEKITALSKIKKEDPNAYKYLVRKGLIYTSKESRRVDIPWQGEDE